MNLSECRDSTLSWLVKLRLFWKEVQHDATSSELSKDRDRSQVSQTKARSRSAATSTEGCMMRVSIKDAMKRRSAMSKRKSKKRRGRITTRLNNLHTARFGNAKSTRCQPMV